MEILSEGAGTPAPADREAQVAVLRQRVAEAARWCATGFDPDDLATSLRQLPARVLFGPTAIDVGAEVRVLIADRAAALALLPESPAELNGRIVGLIIDESTTDGASDLESRGFFDADNTPAWDTWIGAITLDHEVTAQSGIVFPAGQTHLLALVPGAVKDTVDFALQANPDECLYWLDRALPDLAEAINPPR